MDTAMLFSIIHGNLPQICVTFFMGIWLGVLAWRTGSVWPGMVCHACWNGAWQLWAIGNRFEVLPDTLPLVVRAQPVELLR